MKLPLLITCALPDESRVLRRHLSHRSPYGGGEAPPLLGSLGAVEVLLFHTGMGERRVHERLGAFLDTHRVSLLLSIGYAGGLDLRLPKGALFLAENFSSPEFLQPARRLFGERAAVGSLVSVAHPVESPEAKAALAAESKAAALDMETEAISRLCRLHGLPMLSLRVISDTAGEELAVPFSVCFDSERERPRPGALLAWLARHPQRIGGFLRFVAEMGRARTALADAAQEIVKNLA